MVLAKSVSCQFVHKGLFTSGVGTLNLWLALDTNFRRVPHCRLQQPMQMWGWSWKSQSWCLIRQGMGRATKRASAGVSAGKMWEWAWWQRTQRRPRCSELSSSFSPGKTSPQKSQVPEPSESLKQWGLTLVKSCQVRGCLKKLDAHKSRGCIQGELADICEATPCYHWKLTTIGRGFWGLKWSKCDTYLQGGQKGESERHRPVSFTLILGKAVEQMPWKSFPSTLRTEGDWECSEFIMKGGNNRWQTWQPSIRKVDVAEDIVHLDFSKTSDTV